MSKKRKPVYNAIIKRCIHEKKKTLYHSFLVFLILDILEI